MAPEPDRPLSAQVILSDLDAAPALADQFEAAGFEAGPLVGTSFAISGPAERFEALFGATGHAAFAGSEGGELPLEGLPPELRAGIEAIATTGPPDFGPTSP